MRYSEYGLDGDGVTRATGGRPWAEAYLPDGPAAGVAVILPGGGYREVCVDKEGRDFAGRFAARGWAALVVVYRLPGGRYADPPPPLADARAALALAADRAGEWGAEPARIGLVGFSAGGHLALLAAVEPGAAPPPRWLALGYPVVSGRPGLAHPGSFAELLGPAPSAELTARYSLETRIGPGAPPLFIVHADDDGAVPAGNAAALAAAYAAAGRPCRYLRHPTGGHGFGLGPAIGRADAPDWLPGLFAWLEGPEGRL
jgi:acetyl esterase/lipase